MIYFDNAATTYPKPKTVVNAVNTAMIKYGGNPGRSGHQFSLSTGEAVYSVREKLSKMFDAKEENCVFTLNCTEALNIAIKGIAVNGGHFVISDLEHNSVSRPVHSLKERKICTFSVAETFEDDEKTIKSFIREIRKNTVAVVMTASSNVTGQVLPYKEIADICKNKKICFILDIAQAAGVQEIKIGNGINFICGAGHKGLYGLMGTGFLISDGNYMLKTLIEGGTGSLSAELVTPDFLPDRFEAGTPNVSGIISLGAGIDFVTNKGIDNIYKLEKQLKQRFIENMYDEKSIRIITSKSTGTVVSFQVNGTDSQAFAQKLSEKGFALRGGIHCAYLTHKKLHTLEEGTVRFSPSVFNTIAETDSLCSTIKKIQNNY